MTPDVPITLAVTIFACVMALRLPSRTALVALFAVMAAYPSNVNVPPPQLQLTAQRVVGLVLLIRCMTTPEIKDGFKWFFVDTVAIFYFSCTLVAQITTTDPVAAINNRAGFFLSALVPYFCVRYLLTTREAFLATMKGCLWTLVPVAVLAQYQSLTGDSPYRFIMQNGQLWEIFSRQWAELRQAFGRTTFRASAPFQQCIMLGWLFGIFFTPATNLWWERKSIYPWIIAFVFLPIGVLATVSAGPMMMTAMSFAICMMFPLRKAWKAIFGSAGAAYLGISLFAKRQPMEIVASFGFDKSSSYYRVNLLNYVTGAAPDIMVRSMRNPMANHWVFGWGTIPSPWFDSFHDLCVQWVFLVVVHGVVGVIGFFSFVAACAWCLWKGKQKAVSNEDQYLLWSLMSTLLASLLAMQLVALFAEMYNMYHLFLGLVANSMLVVGQSSFRTVGVLAELNGQKVLLRYKLRPGQRLAVVGPPAAPSALDGPH